MPIFIYLMFPYFHARRVLVLTVAAELAVRKDSVNGPGTFLSGLIDELWNLAPETVQQLANIEVR